MRLVTPYAPTTFSKPCIVVSTVWIESGSTRETAILFNHALNADHALAFRSDEISKVEEITGQRKVSEWIVIANHDTKQQAIDYHLALTRNFINGGTDEEWRVGMYRYLKLYEEHCPADMKDQFDTQDKPMD